MSNHIAAVRESDLRMAYVEARLAEIERTRRIYLAAEGGMPQRDIARAVHLSQASVHRLVARAKVLGVGGSVEEVVLQRYAGRISTDEMFRALGAAVVWRPRVVDPVDGVLPGSSEEDVEALLDGGFLTEAEVDQILDAHE
ncbi:winged helix-turn-helix domain-containing protein [Promicromonospora sukumoe]|uniref:winged helix-turn-helix domain-containing protein n=1 Tax=Promicromonospora sukumoe TaxID=88382 RepID=UPI0003659A52|nr:winged helix-turn-helix domain-containing protein [Promicromonospora sukumoe]